jgi:molybdopterin converting factor small subunit
MAYIKQAFSAFPIIIVSHTAKMLGQGESEYLSPRGASAWTGDAQGVYTVFKDGDMEDAPRVLKAVKVRFPTKFSELTFDLVSNREQHKDVLGYDSTIWFSHSVARPLAPGERAQLKEDIKEQKENKAWEQLAVNMLDLIRNHPNKSRSYYERLPVAQGGVKAAQDRKERVLTTLLADGLVVRVELDKPQGRANHYLTVDEDVVKAYEQTKYGV